MHAGQLNVDDYIPFTFQAYRGILPNPYLWLIGTQVSLLELTIEAESKAVLGVTLTLYKKEVREHISSEYDAVEMVPGVPVVCVEGFGNRRHEDECELTLFREGNRFVVVFNNSIVPTRCLRVDRVGFYSGEGELCGVGFFDITGHEIERLIPHFQRLG